MSKLSEERRRVAGLDLATAEQELKEKRRALFDLRIQKERGEVKDTRQFAKTKDDIARLMYTSASCAMRSNSRMRKRSGRSLKNAGKPLGKNPACRRGRQAPSRPSNRVVESE